MLRRHELEQVVQMAMEQFARQNNGLLGWEKVDIENEILLLGGTKEDVYQAIRIGIDICLCSEKVLLSTSS